MKISRFFVLFTICLFLVSCGSRVQTERPTDRDLTQYNTFAYLPNANVNVEGMGYDDENINRAIVDAINANMQEEGYTLDRDNPDLLVLVSVNTQMGQRTTQEPVFTNYPYAAGGPATINPVYDPYFFRGYQGWMGGGGIMGWTRDTSVYEEGTLIIDLVDRESHETVWRGTLSEDIFGQDSTLAIRDMVNEVFEELSVDN